MSHEPVTLAEALQRAADSVENRVEVQGSAGEFTCRGCDERTHALHSLPGERERIVCGPCAGKANRRITDRMAEAVRALRVADNPRATAYLVAHGYGDTAALVRKRREDPDFDKPGNMPRRGGTFE
jgi:hypothetical protein